MTCKVSIKIHGLSGERTDVWEGRTSTILMRATAEILTSLKYAGLYSAHGGESFCRLDEFATD
jgi:hypothetical protein